MTPADPRHGQYAGAVAHWFDGERPCDECAQAEWRYRKRRKLDALRGRPRSVLAIGTLRRVQALNALGYASTQIAEEAGLSIATLRSIGYHDAQTIHRTTADAVARAYERLCMTRPEGGYAHRSRNMARRKGWLPPLAWDDIDDPDERPGDCHFVEIDRSEAIRELADMGLGITQAARRLQMKPDALEKWCSRHRMRDVYRRLAARESLSINQHNREGVA